MKIVNWIEEYWHISPEVQWKLTLSFLVVFFLWVIRYLAIKIIFKNIKNIKERYFWKNGVKNTYYAFLIITIGAIWVEKIGSLATFLGLVTAGLAIALQDPIVNLAGWLFILIRRPFEVGDRIEIGGIAGDVIDVRFFQFTINEINNWVDADQSTGRIIHVPNGKVFKEPQANYSQGFSHIWNEIGVLVTFESNWQTAKEVLEKIAKDQAEHLSKAAEKRLIEASKKYMIFYTSLTPIVYTAVKDSGVMLTMRYLVNPRKRRTTEHKIWEEVLRVFAKHADIDFAYPTQRIYYNLKEGKQAVPKGTN
ncbi:MAG: mechanosensitive ion channel family protein [Reichenbachiella sp.]|uniref:mechanosensitive ion channel family protein n=1 Tax=Reichenbachiella sp. TaxID=2184521 RepID=UPI0032661DE3